MCSHLLHNVSKSIFQILSSAHDLAPLSSTANSTYQTAQSTCKRAVSCSPFSLLPMHVDGQHLLSSRAGICGHDWSLADGIQADVMHTSSRTAPGKPGLPAEHCMELLRRQWLRPSLVAHTVKNLPAMQETWVGKIPWRKEWLTSPVFLPGESHGQKRLVCYNPWGHKKSNMTEQLRKHAQEETEAKWESTLQINAWESTFRDIWLDNTTRGNQKVKENTSVCKQGSKHHHV